MLRGWAHLDLGELEAGLEDARNSISELQKAGTLIWMQFSYYLLARALAADGQLQEASDIVDRLLPSSGRRGGAMVRSRSAPPSRGYSARCA